MIIGLSYKKINHKFRHKKSTALDAVPEKGTYSYVYTQKCDFNKDQNSPVKSNNRTSLKYKKNGIYLK